MAVAFLKERNLGRILAGHPWVYAADILRVEKSSTDGGEITIRTTNGNYIGNGFYNSKSRIPIRIFSRSREKLDESFFRRRFLEAKSFRENILPNFTSNVYRMVWSEADFLPGLVIDRYGDVWVIQTLTLAMDQRKDLFVTLLRDIFGAEIILGRHDVASRQFEGLPQQKEILLGKVQERWLVTLGLARFEVNLMEGQKTGSYLDQIANQIAIGSLARGRRVLDCFAYEGGFAIHTALGGAAEVEALDLSKEAVAAGYRNAELNGVNWVKWKVANVFDVLNVYQRLQRKFDLIVLDPPSFTKSRSKLTEALRGYKEIHLRAFKLLSSGGLLATFCCSHHVDAETFRAVVLDAAFDARKILRLRQIFLQSPDHPIIPSIPETEYLKGFLFEVIY